MKILSLYIVLLSLLSSNDKYDTSIKFFSWTGFVYNNGKLDFRLPINEIRVQELLYKKIETQYYKVFYINKKPTQVIKYLLPEKRIDETTFLDDKGIVRKTIFHNMNESNISLTCKYSYEKLEDSKKLKNTKICDNGLKEITYYNSLIGLYKRITLKNDKVMETMRYRSPYCYYYDNNNSFIEKDACILESDNIPVKLF